MEIVTITEENLEKEHICCAISNNKDCQVAAKKSWLAERLKEGLVFKKGDVRGKCFIEYIPAEKAWAPVEAEGYMYIDCMWVSGQFKGHGYSNLLLNECIEDSKAKGKKGLVVISSDKKRPFLSDSKYLEYKGFKKADAVAPFFTGSEENRPFQSVNFKRADAVAPFFTLMYLPFEGGAAVPKFKDSVHNGILNKEGYVIYYTNQCPFTAKYVPLLEKMAEERGVKLSVIHIQSSEEAQKAPIPFTAFSLFYNGEFVTHEILSENKFQTIINERM